jgi:hypothetical protein
MHSKSPSHHATRAPRRWLPLLTLAIAGTLAVACSSAPKNPAATGGKPGLYLVSAQETPFYKFGPAQGNGPDARLKKGQLLTMVEKHYGYSRVQTEDSQAGFVATEDIEPAPPDAQPTPAPAGKKSGTGSGYGRSPGFEQPNDIPLPASQLPSDIPAPSFRY